MKASDLERFGAVPREVRLTANGKTLVALAIMFAAVAVATAIGLPILRAAQQAERDFSERDAVVTDATIARVTVRKGENARRVITFRYAAADGVHEKTVRLREKDSRDAVEGGRLRIWYLGSRPAESWLAGDAPSVLPFWLLPMLPIAPLVIAALIARRVRRDWALLTEGRFAAARVISSKRVSRSHHHAYQVKYEFTTLSGATVTSATERGRPVPTGVVNVTIVYHRENPRWNAIYPLSLVSPVRG